MDRPGRRRTPLITADPSSANHDIVTTAAPCRQPRPNTALGLIGIYRCPSAGGGGADGGGGGGGPLGRPALLAYRAARPPCPAHL